jgi:hypothetical protein
MTNYTLTADQRDLWAKLHAFIVENAINISNSNQMQAAIRQFALKVIEDQPYEDRIVVGEQTLQLFGDEQDSKELKSKAAFLAHHRKPGMWGTDPILFSVLNALGYQTQLFLAGSNVPPYIPFELSSGTGLRIDIVNYGAKKGGNHWERRGQRNPGNGDCMYYTLAQQIAQDLPNVAKQLDMNAPLQSDNKKSWQSFVAQVTAEFKKLEQKDHYREFTALNKLNQYTTQELIEQYHFAVNNLVGSDTYLKRRPAFSAQENEGDNFLQLALETAVITADKASEIRGELLHMLSKEAWRNPLAYDALMQASVASDAVDTGLDNVELPALISAK